MTATTLFICVACRGADAPDERPGRELFEAVTALAAQTITNLRIAPVECLSVCKRPCTVALAAAGKWTYVVGDLDPKLAADDVLAAALRYAMTADGIVPWRERVLSFRKGVVARIPPLPAG